MRSISVLHITYSSFLGGAGIAASRLNQALNQSCLASSSLLTHDMYVSNLNPASYTSYLFRAASERILLKIFSPEDSVQRSLGLYSSNLPDIVNSTDVDIVHLHWINNCFLTINDICRIAKPVVWTLHDMWPFCGSEHLSYDSRYINSYLPPNSPSRIFDIDRLIWRLKAKKWSKPLHIICPSSWLQNAASSSSLMRTWPVHHIYNTLDTSTWKPYDTLFARKELTLPLNVPLVLFGSHRSAQSHHKGLDLFIRLLHRLKSTFPAVQVVICGDVPSDSFASLPCPVHRFGLTTTTHKLRLIYSACDVTVIPSRIENLPNMAIESLACGTPVSSFNVGGISDITSTLSYCALAQPFSITEFFHNTARIIDDRMSYRRSSALLHQDIDKRFSYQTIASHHLHLYSSILNGDRLKSDPKRR